jgi:putative ABC transport system substrate-binding protein
LPWVFSTVNVLGAYTGEEENVAGVLDFLDFSIYIEFMRSVLPEMRTVGLLFGETVGNEMILGEILGSESYFADVGLSFVGLDVVMTFEEFKENVLSYQGDVDFLLMGYAESFQDENGEPVTREEVVRWLVENNKIPEFSYDNSLVEEGLFSSLTSSYYGQGVASGKIAYGILIDGKAPSEIETKTVETYDKHINLARAKSLHLEVPNIVLINSEVVEKFPWEEEE